MVTVINKTPAVPMQVIHGDSVPLTITFYDSNGAQKDKSTSTIACSYWTTTDMSGAADGTLTVDDTDDATGIFIITGFDGLGIDQYYARVTDTISGNTKTKFEISLTVTDTYGQGGGPSSVVPSITIEDDTDTIVINELGATYGGGGGASVSDDAYGVGWDGDTSTAASKNAIYDKIETISAGGDAWGDVVDSDIIPDGDGTRDLGSDAVRFAETYTDDLFVTGDIDVGGSVDGIDLQTLNTAVSANTAKVTNATHTGDVTGSTALTIADNAVTSAKINAGAVTQTKISDEAVTNAKLAHVATETIKGRLTAATGDVEDITLLDALTALFLSVSTTDQDPGRQFDKLIALDGAGPGIDTLKLVTLNDASGKIPPDDITANHDLVQDDLYKIHLVDDNTVLDITVQDNATEDLPVGAWAGFICVDELCQFVEDTSVTIITPTGYVAAAGAVGRLVILWQSDTDEWRLLGNLESA